MLLSVYYALVNSQLMYGISIWGSGGSISNLCCLFSAQKKCLRSLFRVKRISILCPGHTKSTFTAYNILTVHNLYFYSVLTSIFSSLYSCQTQPIVDQVKPHLSKRKEAYLNWLTMVAILQLRASKHFVYFVSIAVVTFTLLNILKFTTS